MKLVRVFCLVVFALFALNAFSNPPSELDYQGKVLVNDVPYNGNGYFKFAISDVGGSTNFWSNDGTTGGGGQPLGCLTNPVFNGVFSSVLGAAPMTAINPDIFSNGNDLYLRVWFGTTNSTFNEMLPAQKLESSAYAINSDQVDGMDAAEIVAAATNGVSLSGDISGSPAAGTTVNSLQGDALAIGAAAAGEVLTWDGTAWTNAPAAGGGMSPVIASNSFVIKTGDTMSGALFVNAPRGLKIGSASNEVEIGRLANGAASGVAVGSSAMAQDQGVAVGYNAGGGTNGVAVGNTSRGGGSGTAVGASANGTDHGVAVGELANGNGTGAAIGRQSSGFDYGVGVGYGANGVSNGVAVGRVCYGYDYGVAVGRNANGSGSSVAVGYGANGTVYGAAVGSSANGNFYGCALGSGALATNAGVAVGWAAAGDESGAAVGYSARASSFGAAVGRDANGTASGAALGYAANGYSHGVAVGNGANGRVSGVAVGENSAGFSNGVAVGNAANGVSAVAVGNAANGYGQGAAVGEAADASTHGAAVGYLANAIQGGAAVGYNANANWAGVAVGEQSQGGNFGVAIGQYSDGRETNVAIGVQASAGSGSERIAIGHNVNNSVDHSARIRGTLYMDGGTALVARSTFGGGTWTTLVPLPSMENVVWVATNGSAFGAGTVDRPFDTPQRGYDYAANVYTNDPSTVVICAGRYPAMLNMHAKSVHLFGLDRPQLNVLQVNNTPAPFVVGKIRVENVVFTGSATVSADMGGVKFNNCRFQNGLYIYGGKTEVMNCYATAGDGPAISVGNGTAVQQISIYNSAAELDSAVFPAVIVAANVGQFEMKGNQVVNIGGMSAIVDQETPGPISPLHLYVHNYIKGPSPFAGPGGTPAVADLGGGTTNTIAFHQNTVWGHVGVPGSYQFQSDNVIYGLMIWTPSVVPVVDAADNTQIMPGGAVALPNSWQD